MEINTFIEYLESRRGAYLRELTARLGPRDTRYKLGTIGFCAQAAHPPYIQLASDKQTINIFLRRGAATPDTPEFAEWELSHECVHLLDPYFEETYTNVLEEGLAVCFQAEINQSPDHDYNIYPALAAYKSARRLVQKHYNINLFNAIKNLRRAGHRIGDLTAEQLTTTVPRLTLEEAEELSHRFVNAYDEAGRAIPVHDSPTPER